MIISLLGGLALFLYGMDMLGSGLEKVSGGKLEQTLEKLTNNIFKSVLLGAIVTAAIQSSSATTVIVVGLVNSRILKLRQAIGVIMGANIGTTITAHILRLSDISSDNLFLMLLKPKTLAPAIALIGILLFMASKRARKKELGQILLGFAILFTGMFNMEAAVSPLKDSPAFSQMFASFQNPVLGVIVGAGVTAIIQSSSASVGILQALSSTGSITYASAAPIIMGQNIGTCITALLASIGATKNAKRTAAVHLSFNIIGTALFLAALYAFQALVGFPFWNDPIDRGGIANFHTVFNVVVTVVLVPFAAQLEKLACTLVKETREDMDSDEVILALDDRFLHVPSLALQHSREAVVRMGTLARLNLQSALALLKNPDPKAVDRFKTVEDALDLLEDKVGNYLLKIPQAELSEADSHTLSEMLHVMSEFERIGDYSMNIVEFSQQMHESGDRFSAQAQAEMDAIGEAVFEIVDITTKAFEAKDIERSYTIEPLEEIIDRMQETLKDRHIERLRQGRCSVNTAFPFVETLSCLERIADHCSNVGIHIINHENPDISIDRHEYLVMLHKGGIQDYSEHYKGYEEKYFSRIMEA